MEEDAAKRALGRLREVLLDLGFPVLCAAYGADRDRTNAFRFHRGCLTECQQTVCDLLFLEESVDIKDVGRLLPGDSIEALKRLGIFSEVAGFIRLNGLRLVFHFGVWIFCQSRGVHAFAYYDSDSLALGRICQDCRGRILDFASGVGTQGIALAPQAIDVVCVDTNANVSHLFEINALLNGVHEKVCLQIGDESALNAYQRRFDYIVCNPPLLPIPTGLPYPTVGDGGPDGQSVLGRLLSRADRVLAMNGSVRFVTTILGDEHGPDLDRFNELSSQNGFRLTLFCLSRAGIWRGEPMFEAVVQTAVDFGAPIPLALELCSAHFGRENSRFLYFVLGTAMRARAGHAANLEVTPHYLLNQNAWSL